MVGENIRRLIRAFLVYGIGGILQKFMGLLLLPLFTRVLSPEDYGVLALVSFVAVALSGFFSLGTGNSMGLLYFKETDLQRRVVVVWSTAVLMLVNGVFLASALCLAAEPISLMVFQTPDYANLLRLSFLGLVLASVMDPFLAYLRMEEKASQYVTLTLMSAGLAIALNAWFVLGLRWGIIGATIAGVVSSAISVGAVGWVVARRLPFRLDAALFKSLFRAGFPPIFGLFAFLLIDYADRQLLQRMAGQRYLCGGGVGGYQEDEAFSAGGLSLVYQQFIPAPYTQNGAVSFVPGLSIIDAAMNLGWSGVSRLLVFGTAHDA